MPQFSVEAMRALHGVAENALVTLHCKLSIVAHVVTGNSLPCDAAPLRDGLNMVVSLGIACYGNHCCYVRRNDHLRIRLFVKGSLRNGFTIIRTVTHESVEGSFDLADQIRDGGRVAYRSE